MAKFKVGDKVRTVKGEILTVKEVDYSTGSRPQYWTKEKPVGAFEEFELEPVKNAAAKIASNARFKVGDMVNYPGSSEPRTVMSVHEGPGGKTEYKLKDAVGLWEEDNLKSAKGWKTDFKVGDKVTCTGSSKVRTIKRILEASRKKFYVLDDEKGSVGGGWERDELKAANASIVANAKAWCGNGAVAKNARPGDTVKVTISCPTFSELKATTKTMTCKKAIDWLAEKNIGQGKDALNKLVKGGEVSIPAGQISLKFSLV